MGSFCSMCGEQKNADGNCPKGHMTNAMQHGCSVDGWECFHCGELFTTVGAARNHFGARPDAEPGCLVRVKLGEERGLLIELREKENEIAKLRTDIECDSTGTKVFNARLQSELFSYKPFRECRSIYDVFCLYDSMEGRAIAAEERLARVRGDN